MITPITLRAANFTPKARTSTLTVAGEPRADALHEAQLEMKRKYPDPFYWGALICQGDPGPLLSRASI